MIIHENFEKVKSNYFRTIQTAIYNCLNDKHYVHIFFQSSNNVHKFDKYFSHGRIKLFHSVIKSYTNDVLTSYTNDVKISNICYKEQISKTGFDYHWIIKLNPDILIFDEFIFKDIRTKYSYKHIHARSRFYIGPIQLKKHQKSKTFNYKSFDSYPAAEIWIDVEDWAGGILTLFNCKDSQEIEKMKLANKNAEKLFKEALAKEKAALRLLNKIYQPYVLGPNTVFKINYLDGVF